MPLSAPAALRDPSYRLALLILTFFFFFLFKLISVHIKTLIESFDLDFFLTLFFAVVFPSIQIPALSELIKMDKKSFETVLDEIRKVIFHFAC